MESFKSTPHSIACDAATIYSKLTNPSLIQQQIEANADRIDEQARQHLDTVKFTEDSISIQSPMGEVALSLDRENSIEDQLSTGNNCLKCYNTVSEAGGIVLGAVVIYDYQFSMASKALKRAKLPIITLTNFETMLDVALDGGTINQADADTLQQWHSDPENWVAAGFEAVD